jgi:Transposase DDE domain
VTTTVPMLARTLQTLFTDDADFWARQTGAVQRVRRFSGASLVQTLVFGWLRHPNATLEDLAGVADRLGVPVSAQSLDERLHERTADCLANLLGQALQYLVAAQPAAVPLLRRFQGVYIQDSTSIALPASLAPYFPGCGSGTPGVGLAALKLQLRFELTTGVLDGLTGHSGRDSDRRAELTGDFLPPGALRLTDLGYFDLGMLQHYDDQGVYYLNRLPARVRIRTADGRSQLLSELLAGVLGDTFDAVVTVGAGQSLSGRLIAVRVPAAVSRKRRARLLKEARRKGRRVSVIQEELCDWTVLLTNVPVGMLTVAEALALLRARWQIELLIKVWKSEGRLDETGGTRQGRVLCEVLAKLLAQVVRHWTTLVTGGPRLQSSATREARAVGRLAVRVAVCLASASEGDLCRLLRRLRRRLARLARLANRRRRPLTFQVLTQPDKHASIGSFG